MAECEKLSETNVDDFFRRRHNHYWDRNNYHRGWHHDNRLSCPSHFWNNYNFYILYS